MVGIMSGKTAHPTGARIDWFRTGFLAVLGLWILLPFAAASGVAQDAVPYVVAGRLVASHPDDVYPRPPDRHLGISQRFRDDYCTFVDVPRDRCDAIVVAYLATPLALPFAWLIGHTSGKVASLVMRLAAALVLASGMWLLWERLASRTRSARTHLLVTAIALTPMATTAIGFGQTSPLMFLSVCLGLGATTKLRKALSVLVWVGASVFKAFPAALGLLILWLRRWRFALAAAVAFVALGIVALFLAPPSIVGDFIRSSSGISGSTIHGSVDALVQKALGDGTIGSTLGRSAGILAALGCCWAGMRRTTVDVRWAAGWVALLLASPLVELHYLWVPVAGVAIALSAQRRLNDRLLMLLPLSALLTIPPSLVPDPTKGIYPTYQALGLLVTAAMFSWLAVRSRTISGIGAMVESPA